MKNTDRNKFKVWNKTTNSFDNNYLYVICGNGILYGISSKGQLTIVDRDNFIVCWSASVKDKNGILIYEDDITNKGIVKFHDKIIYDCAERCAHPGFYFASECDLNSNYDVVGCLELRYQEPLYDCKVIGNIYENPELINTNLINK